MQEYLCNLSANTFFFYIFENIFPVNSIEKHVSIIRSVNKKYSLTDVLPVVTVVEECVA